MDLIDGLTIAGHVSSPVAVSEESPYRRKFSSVYDALKHGEIDFDSLFWALFQHQPEDSERIAGYEVYALDCTTNERDDAPTLPDRGCLKKDKADPVRYGHKYSWLVRLIRQRTSWIAPVDVLRVDSALTDSQVGANQVKELDDRNAHPKVAVADSLYANQWFLGCFLTLKTLVALVRLKGNLNLYEEPEPRHPKSKGAPRKHGRCFKLSNPYRPADQEETFRLGAQSIRVQAWHQLHLKKLAALVGTVLKVEFLKADGSLRYKRPMWLFWTGSREVALPDIVHMYLWRFAIEHAFRFMKQHLGLNQNRSNNLVNTGNWMWMCALAYWQLLLMQDLVCDHRPAWHPRSTLEHPRHLSPRQVQRQALPILVQFDTPACTPKHSGKGTGRAKGYHPAPRTRFSVVFKTKSVSPSGP
jgi:hypothetical protein